jgi:hypothetical protein
VLAKMAQCAALQILAVACFVGNEGLRQKMSHGKGSNKRVWRKCSFANNEIFEAGCDISILSV